MIKAYQKPYVIGMDGGGTKTKICIADLEGHVFDSFSGGSMNINSQGADGVRQNLASIFKELRQRGADWTFLRGICLGAAGISNPLARQTLKEAVLAAGITREPLILGDHEIALYGAHGCARGLILIAGTGSVCYGMDGNGKQARAGGFGHLIDDEGSGYAIGRDVLSAIVRAEDGRQAATCMKEAVLQKLNLTSIAQLIQYVYNPQTGKKEIAALAPLVMKGIEAKEEGAEEILDKAAQQLAEMVFAVLRQLDLNTAELAFCGSVLLKNENLAKRLQKKIKIQYPKVTCIYPKQEAAVGAVLGCLQEMQNQTDVK